jgi:hypothetical protein
VGIPQHIREARRDSGSHIGKTVKIEASLACANFKNLERDIRQLEKASVDYLT